MLGFLEDVSVRRQNLLCFSSDVVHTNLVSGDFASIFQVKQIGMITKELQKREVIVFNDVLVAVAGFVS